jgi:hypothetical protein
MSDGSSVPHDEVVSANGFAAGRTRSHSPIDSSLGRNTGFSVSPSAGCRYTPPINVTLIPALHS